MVCLKRKLIRFHRGVKGGCGVWLAMVWSGHSGVQAYEDVQVISTLTPRASYESVGVLLRLCQEDLMQKRRWFVGGLGIALSFASWTPLEAQGQLPLAPQRASGLAVSPVYEGWYENPDGTYSISFGYINRNTEEVLEVPVGSQNSLEGGELSQGLPTRFLPHRHYGIYTVTVPADFGADDEVVWTLKLRGQEFSIPGRLNPLYQIDALGAPATGEKPPVLRLDPAGPEVVGPRGAVAGPLEAMVGEPLSLTAWAREQEEETEADEPQQGQQETEEGEDEDQLTLWWYEWSGPGEVTFSETEVPVDAGTGSARTTATFSEPGDYVLYVRTNDSGDGGAGHEQCCWTNGYVKVTVTR